MTRSILSFSAPPRGATTRDRLLDAAATLFYERGFHAIGLDQVLEEVGVTKTTFYNHFESKDELIVAVLEHRSHRDMQALAEEMDKRCTDPRERILLVFDVLDEWFHDPDFRGCLYINAAIQFPNPNDPVHRAASAHGDDLHRLFELLTRQAEAADPEMLARQLCMLITAALSSRQAESDLLAARTAREMARTLLASALPIERS